MFKVIQKKSIFFEESGFCKLNETIQSGRFSKMVVVLVDENTKLFCLDLLKQNLECDFKVIAIPVGEEFKTIHTCLTIWEKLSDLGIDRNSLLISLGGGVVTDIGGFVASCFKRGISFIHIPTSLLGMVDAAIGGKNGVDLNSLKNQIGVIRPPKMVIIETEFLKTLPDEQIISGFAEMLKHGLIQSKDYFKSCIGVGNLSTSTVGPLIEESVSIKLNIVEEDINENGLRKALNYGHTLGHAIESYRMSLPSSKHLLHGEAIAIGLVLETFISFKTKNFPQASLEELKQFVHKIYPYHVFRREEQDLIIDLMKHDKKNSNGNVNFVLLRDIGQPKLDCKVENELIYEAFNFYHQKNIE